jgi:hypothetical protein
MTLRIDSRRLLIGSTFILLSGFVGCSIFDERIEPTLTAEITAGGDAGSTATPPAEPANQYTVEVRFESGKAERLVRPMTGQLCVQEALEQSGASKKFRRFNLELYRPLPGGRWHRMVLEYDRANRRVPPECDYAMLPGDRIVVVEDISTMFDDVANTILLRAGLDPLSKSPEQKIAERYRVGD